MRIYGRDIYWKIINSLNNYGLFHALGKTVITDLVNVTQYHRLLHAKPVFYSFDSKSHQIE